MSALTARAVLFSCIEGGSMFWSDEIAAYGPESVHEKLIGGGYAEDKHSAGKIADRARGQDGQAVLEEIAKSGSFFLTPEDEDWPAQLDDLKATPIALILKGERELLFDIAHSISIVGTRNPTPYGSRVAADFAASACDRNFAVISGGAYGIDACAHRGALAAEGMTVAVLAGGISRNYPAGHEKLFVEIAETGLLISEVLPQVSALPARFLIRNRLIAALSRGTIVVEAAFRSGSIRTAREA
ncbi:MAG: DNA-protecting protein DprA, partial [Actinobacteria bacterium]|nr:DNA-protecting protein DprA [Actinomycetota bacterium]